MDPFIPALVLSKTLEFGVTEYGLKRGMIEGNLLQSDRPSRIVLNSAFLVGGPLLYKEIKKKHRKMAKATAIVLIVGNSFLVVHNLKLINSSDQQRVNHK